MYPRLLSLASVLALLLASPGWGCNPRIPLPAERIKASPLPAGEVQLTGELRYYRHIDPVTGQGAVEIHADGKDVPLDFRQFKLDIHIHPGTWKIKGQWSKEQRLVVTAATPA